MENCIANFDRLDVTFDHTLICMICDRDTIFAINFSNGFNFHNITSCVIILQRAYFVYRIERGVIALDRHEIFWYLLSRLAVALSVLLCLPLGLALWDAAASGEPLKAGLVFILPLCLAAGLSVLFWRRGRNHARPLQLAEGALFAVLAWPFLAFVGMWPFFLTGALEPLDAFFEAMAAVSATGLSHFDDIFLLPPALALWHGLLNGLGGLTFVVLLVTVLPQVSGCFGLILSARQTVYFSPVWRKMHQSIWQGLSVYGGLLALFFLILLLLGVSPFRACVTALATVSTAGSGGMSGAFAGDSRMALAGIFMMLVAGGNFLLYWKTWARRSWKLLLQDTALRMTLALFAVAGTVVSLHLWFTATYDLSASITQGFFHVASFFTTSGFASADICAWPDFDRSVLFLLACTGACIGSPAGGLKVVRLIVLARLAHGELRRTLHPRMIVSIRLDGLAVPDKIASRILAFFFLSVAVLIAGTLALAATGTPILPSLGLAAGCLTSTGQLAQLFGLDTAASLTPAAKLIAALLMLIGRAEIFAFFMLGAIAAEKARKKWG